MVEAKVLEAVKYFERCVREGGLSLSKIVIFGSSGTGTSTIESDVDIAVISDDFRGKDVFYRALLTKDAEINTIRKFRIPLDVITLTPEEFNEEHSLLVKNIRKGVTISSASSV